MKRKFQTSLTDLQMINARRFLAQKRKGWSNEKIAADAFGFSPSTVEIYIRNAEAEEKHKNPSSLKSWIPCKAIRINNGRLLIKK